jgi:hypothetical protein
MNIFLDHGHGTPPCDTGAIGILNEEKVVREIGMKMYEILKSWGHGVAVSNATDGSTVTNSLSKRVQQANQFDPDLFISLHCNAHLNERQTTPNPMGCEVLAASNQGEQYGQKVCQNLSKLGFKNRGVKDGSGIFVIKYTQQVAILIEFFFLDSEFDCALYHEVGPEKIAMAVCSAITGKSIEPIQEVPISIAPTASSTSARTKMATSEVTSSVRPHFLVDASKYDAGLEHQVEAWDWLQTQIPPSALAEFHRRFTPGKSVGMATESVVKTFDPSKIDWSNPNCKISEYFRVLEVTMGDPDRVPLPNSEIAKNIIVMAQELDKVRKGFGKPITTSSWNRPPLINNAVGGASKSQHLWGKGVDIYPLDGNVNDLQAFCDKHWYGALGYGAHKGFVHLDNRNGKGYETGGEKGPRWDY